jgi:hypothetical protein
MRRRVFIKRISSWFALSIIANEGCGMSSFGCKEQWRAVLGSKSATEERERAKAFAACASKERMGLQLELLDRSSGQQVPVANVASATSPLTVRVTLKGSDEPQIWQPLDNASVLELLGE